MSRRQAILLFPSTFVQIIHLSHAFCTQSCPPSDVSTVFSILFICSIFPSFVLFGDISQIAVLRCHSSLFVLSVVFRGTSALGPGMGWPTVFPLSKQPLSQTIPYCCRSQQSSLTTPDNTHHSHKASRPLRDRSTARTMYLVRSAYSFSTRAVMTSNAPSRDRQHSFQSCSLASLWTSLPRNLRQIPTQRPQQTVPLISGQPISPFYMTKRYVTSFLAPSRKRRYNTQISTPLAAILALTELVRRSDGIVRHTIPLA